MYSLFKPIAFAIDPERAHNLTLANLEFAAKRVFLNSQLKFLTCLLGVWG